MLRTLIEVGKEKTIPFRFRNVTSDGTDAGAILLTKPGIPGGTVALSCRQIHDLASIAYIDDLEHTVALVTGSVKAISQS